MLVLSRRVGQAIVVGDDVVITLKKLDDDSAEIEIVRSELRGRLTTAIFEGTLRAGDSVEFAPDCRCRIADIRVPIARVGVDVPRTLSVHRREVVEALRRQRGGRRDSD